MFLYESKESVNTEAELTVGVYYGRASTYELEGGQGSLIMGEFSLSEANTVSFIELLIEPAPGAGYSYRDFQLLPDGHWRDSSGEKSKNVALMFPPELLIARLVAQRDLPPVRHGVMQ